MNTVGLCWWLKKTKSSSCGLNSSQRRDPMLLLLLLLSGRISAPRQKEQLLMNQHTHTRTHTHTLNGDTHLRERTERCKQARGASEGYILSPQAPAATSLEAESVVEGSSPGAVLSRCAGLHFFRFLPTTSCLCMT